MGPSSAAAKPLRFALPLVLVCYTLSAVAFGLVTPVYEGPDEIGHILYVKHIAEGLGIPVQSREYAVAYGFGQEGSQPPLYYALNAGIVRAFGLSLTELNGMPPANPFTNCGRPHTGSNVAGFRHDPVREAFPYQGAARAVHVMRIFSALLGAATVAATYAATRLAIPPAPIAALVAAVVVAFNPQFTFMGGVVNNDNLVNLLVAAAVALTLCCLQRGFTWWRALVLGAVCGLAPLAKLGGLLALAFAVLGLLLVARDHVSSGWRGLVSVAGYGALVLAAFLAVSGWWFVRNWFLYGDPTGTNVMLSIYGGRKGWPVHLILPELRATFRSYWATFACGLQFPPPVYWLVGGLVVASLVGWIRGWGTVSTRSRLVASILLGWFALAVALWVRWNQTTYAPLGRLLFQANVAIGPLLGLGLTHLSSRPRWLLAGVGTGLLTLTLAGALLIVQPAFALPARYPATSPPTPARVLPDATFGDEIVVFGYELSPNSLDPGDTLDVALHARALKPISEDYVLAIQFVSPVPGDEEVLVNYNTFPGSGGYGTAAWRPDEVIVERNRLRIPEQVSEARAWRVMAIFYRTSDGRRLPVTVSGQPADGALGLELVRVGASRPADVPEQDRVEPAPVFDEVIALRGARVEAVDGREDRAAQIRVLLWWEALAPPAADLTVFVHLLDESGALVGDGDGPPIGGGFPTSMWQPMDQVADEHVVMLPADHSSQVYSVRVGWYDPATGFRLPLSEEGREAVDGAFTVAKWQCR